MGCWIFCILMSWVLAHYLLIVMKALRLRFLKSIAIGKCIETEVVKCYNFAHRDWIGKEVLFPRDYAEKIRLNMLKVLI